METTSGPIGERVATLQREASKYKGASLPAAVTCLQEAVELMRQHPSNYPLDRWLRLPVVLQKAGLFDAAIAEFHRLLDEVEERVKHEAPRQRPAIRQKFAHLNYFQIYEKMSLVCERQKLVNQAQQYAVLAEQHYQVFMDMSVESGYYRSRHERSTTDHKPLA
ncbi:hypothetical protein QLH52_19880 [Methylomonas sp. OY6]|uniref:Tetratricopeptide repeat protein n=1 Tax=Methylomonas defluvii TaxID=3045149 RepID=A0ABU4UJK6_9GAMM|nr:hypothetical protein [Methylomonas sp. OY6]MDX8129570.1 hypothetical protein [Methylomonas sp. OY6]